MKKNIALLTVTALMLLLSGCSKDEPKPNNGILDANSIDGDSVTMDGDGVYSQNRYNGSSDGMKSVYFDFGVYDISPSAYETVSTDATILRQKLQGNRVKIEGNCDEFGTDEYNYALGLKRAKAVKDSLQAQGISGSQIVLVSYGESNPMCREATDSCYAQNRRADLKLVK